MLHLRGETPGHPTTTHPPPAPAIPGVSEGVEKSVSLQKGLVERDHRKGGIPRGRPGWSDRTSEGGMSGEFEGGWKSSNGRGEAGEGEWEGGKSGNVNTEHVAMRRKRPPSHPFYKGCPESTVRVTAG